MGGMIAATIVHHDKNDFLCLSMQSVPWQSDVGLFSAFFFCALVFTVERCRKLMFITTAALIPVGAEHL